MKKRTNGFLADEFRGGTEVADYIRELHEYLWRVVRVALPNANGRLGDHLDIAMRELEGSALDRQKETT